MDRARGLTFAKQQLCDEKRAQQEKDGHTEIARAADRSEKSRSDCFRFMRSKHTEKGEEPQRVQFWPVVALGQWGSLFMYFSRLYPCQLHSRGHAGHNRDNSTAMSQVAAESDAGKQAPVRYRRVSLQC